MSGWIFRAGTAEMRCLEKCCSMHMRYSQDDAFGRKKKQGQAGEK